jgi:transposase
VENQGLCLTSFQKKFLLKSLESELPLEYRRRIEIMLRTDRGQSQAQICAELKCSQETARYWIFMARSGNAHRWNEQPKGRPKAINEEYVQHLKELVSSSPRDYGYPFQRWTAQWLKKHLAKKLGIEVSERHINRILKNMGLGTRSKKETIEQNVNFSNQKQSALNICDLPSSSSPVFLETFNFIQVVQGQSSENI